jgi:hypothetical protein
MAVLVLDKRTKPLMPCSEKRARLLLERGRAVVHRMRPFTIRLKDRTLEDSALQPLQIKIDPGSQTTGVMVIRADDADPEQQQVVMLIDIDHRGQHINDFYPANWYCCAARLSSINNKKLIIKNGQQFVCFYNQNVGGLHND